MATPAINKKPSMPLEMPIIIFLFRLCLAWSLVRSRIVATSSLREGPGTGISFCFAAFLEIFEVFLVALVEAPLVFLLEVPLAALPETPFVALPEAPLAVLPEALLGALLTAPLAALLEARVGSSLALFAFGFFLGHIDIYLRRGTALSLPDNISRALQMHRTQRSTI
jgi:hypothetical protein